jgi:DNA ligase 1
MKAFADLYREIDSTTRTSEKVSALRDFFAHADDADAAWVLFYLSGRRQKRAVRGGDLMQWAAEVSGLPAWLLGECYDAVGDSAETMSLVLPDVASVEELPLHRWVEDRLLPLSRMSSAEQKEVVLSAWRSLDRPRRFLWNKLITGAFRVGVSQTLVVRALAEHAGIDKSILTHRLMGDWTPTPHAYRRLLSPDDAGTSRSRPYPFCLATAVDTEIASLGALADWQIEWKWDGIRAQLIRRGGQTFLWTRGEELVSDRYPEIVAMADKLLDGTVLDGELLAWNEAGVMPFSSLQRRIGRTKLSKSILRDVPVIFLAYDQLEVAGIDVRERSLSERVDALRATVGGMNDDRLKRSMPIDAGDWESVAALVKSSRSRQVEGVMLKSRSSTYQVGRVRGGWWKWKVAPLSVDAVLIMAHRGSGKRANLYTDYTFAVWDEQGELVPVAKAYSGLDDAEIAEVDRFVRSHTRDRFGPVRTVDAELVFEIAFEGVSRSPRHRSGVAVRFPRIARWRHDKKPTDADRLSVLLGMIPAEAEVHSKGPPKQPGLFDGLANR